MNTLFAGSITTLAPISIGTLIVPWRQAYSAIAIGPYAGQTNQSIGAVAIGSQAGKYFQGSYCIAIGSGAGCSNQHNHSIVLNSTGEILNTENSRSLYVAPIRKSIAPNTLYYNTDTKEITYLQNPTVHNLNSGTNWSDYLYWNSDHQSWFAASSEVHLGSQAGQFEQSTGAIAIGVKAGMSKQSESAVALGFKAGQFEQCTQALAIGTEAGLYRQGSYAVALGTQAGFENQGSGSIAIGYQAGKYEQSTGAIAIGYQAGMTRQGNGSVCIGRCASSTYSNSIVLNAGYSCLSATSSSGFFVNPIRGPLAPTCPLNYNPETKEIFYTATNTTCINSIEELKEDTSIVFNLNPKILDNSVGFVSEDVGKIHPKLVTPYTVNYHAILIFMLEEMKKQEKRIAELEESLRFLPR